MNMRLFLFVLTLMIGVTVSARQIQVIDVESVPVDTAETNAFDVVEQMPSFAGGSYTVNLMGADGKVRQETRTCPPGQTGMFQWIAGNMKYPIVAEENGIQGRVVVTFVVERDGSINEVEVAKSVDPSLDKEAVRVVKTMPKWIPGKQKGEPVRVKFTMPITFRLK